MRNRKTVLILGAGASCEFGLPLGKDLKETISGDLRIMFDEFGHRLQSGSYEIVEALRILTEENGLKGDINPHRSSAVSISRAMRLSSSIDEFVERHRDDSKVSDCAKLAIAKAILEAERGSKLYVDPRSEHDDFIGEASGSWLSYLLRDLTRGKTSGELNTVFDNMYIINFNYDRCVEQFTYLWFQQVYGLNDMRSAEITNKLRIHHAYGSLGPLPFQNRSSSVPFGAKVNGNVLHSIFSRIITYSEAFSESRDLDFAKSALSHADKLVFMGFAFHEQNMKLLQISEKIERPSLRCYATTLGVSAPRLEIDKQNLVEAMRVVSLNSLFFEGMNANCEDFWTEYGDVVVQ